MTTLRGLAVRAAEHHSAILRLPGLWPAAGRTFASSGTASQTPAADPLPRPGEVTHTCTQQPGPQQEQPPPSTKLLDGRRVAAAWSAELEAQVPALTRKLGRPPGLAVITVGSRPDSQIYIARKREACHKAGVAVAVHEMPDDVSQADLEARVTDTCGRADVDAVLIQLPLPPHLSEDAVMERLAPHKDVDGFHPLNMGRMLMRNRVPRLVPCTPLGVMELLRRSGVPISGKTAVIVGDSNVVGTPLAAMLRDSGAAAVTVCHRMSYSEWFDDQDHVQQQRADAAACLPRLPGPGSLRLPLSEETAGSTQGGGSCEGSSERRRSSNSSSSSSSSSDSDSNGGRSSSRSPPVPEGLLQLEATPTFMPYQLPDITRSADILVVAVGHPGLVRAEWVKRGAVVVDIGINVIPTSHYSTHDNESGGGGSGGGGGGGDGGSKTMTVVGDVAFEEVSQVASLVSPVPGGVGPMTIAAVLHNVIKAANMNLRSCQ